MTQRETLKDGEWMYRRLGEHWKALNCVFVGTWETRHCIRKVTKYQAMALARNHGIKGVFFGARDGNGKWMDIRVVGDLDAFYRGNVQELLNPPNSVK